MKKGIFQTVLLILILGFIPIENSLFAQPVDVAFRNLGPADGLPVTSVTSVSQDVSGIIWIGSWDGVYAFDGKRFSIKAENGRYVEADSKGGVWIASGNGNLLHYNILNNSTKTYLIDKNRRYVNYFIDKEDNVWAGGPEGLTKLNTKTDKFETEPGQIKGTLGAPGTIKENKNGDLLFYVRDSENTYSLALRNKNGKYSYIPYPPDKNNPDSNADFLSANSVYSAPYDSSGILILNNYGWAVKETESTDWQFHKYTDQVILDPFDAALSDNNNNVWISFEQKLSRLNLETGKLTSYYHDEKNLNSILAKPGFHDIQLFIDRQGILWIPCFSAGISRLNLYESDFGLVKKPDGEQIVDVLSALEQKDGSYWIGSRKNDSSLVHFSYDGKIIEQFNGDFNRNSPPGRSEGTDLSDPVIWSLAQSADGSVWVGTGTPSPQSGGLNRIEPGNGKIVRFKHDPDDPTSLADNWVGRMLVDGSDRVWLSTLAESGINWIDPNTEQIHWFTIPDALNNLHSDSTSYFLPEIVTSEGDLILIRFANNQPNHFLIHHEDLSVEPFGPTNFPFERLIYNHEDDEGRIWFRTPDGIGYLDSTLTEIAFHYDLKKHNFNAGIDAINSDKAGNIWLATDNGIIKFNPSTEESIHFGFNRGLQENAFKSYLNQKGKSGFIYFGGNGGINRFDPSTIITNPFPPEMVFTGLKLDGTAIQPGTDSAIKQPVNFAKQIIVGPEISAISIDFSAIHFAGYEDNRYQYMLKGFDKNWRDGGTSGNATYTNLTNGKYTLYIKGSNWDGVWSDGSKSIDIIILPPWYKTLLAYVVYIILFILAIFFFDKYRKKRLLEKERALARERELAQAKEIQKAYKNLEVAHESLKSTQAQLIQSEKMASLGELTAGIAHEIQNPLNFVNNFSDLNRELIDELKEELAVGNAQLANEIANDLKDNEQKINHHGKRAEAIVKGMLLHSRGSSGQKELTDINALCDEYLRLSYHGFRAKDKSFNADFKLEVDENLPKIEVVPQDIGRVLLNLINNAFYACAERSRSTGNEKVKQDVNDYKPSVVVITKLLGNKVEIKVQDNGNGVPNSVKEKIFQPFFTTKPTGQGTGLGLSLSYDIIKAHEGTIEVDSSEGKGTEFIIKLNNK